MEAAAASRSCRRTARSAAPPVKLRSKRRKMLRQAAVNAVRQWKYKPYLLDGQPMEIQTQITVNFTLP